MITEMFSYSDFVIMIVYNPTLITRNVVVQLVYKTLLKNISDTTVIGLAQFFHWGRYTCSRGVMTT